MFFNDLKSKWRKNNNYKIIDLQNEGKICYVFISSNGLFLENTEKNIWILENNKYEWENISQHNKIRKNASRLIFIRDIFQVSYTEGIYNNVDSIDKIINLVKNLTTNYDTYIIGNSAGGYLALILGSTLNNVKRVYSFGGLFSLYEWKGAQNNYSFSDVPTYKKYLNEDRAKYYDIRELVYRRNTPIYHFYASKHQGDLKQVSIINKKENIFLFGFNTNIHGKGLNGFDLPSLLSCSDKKLKQIVYKFDNKSNINKNSFSIYCFGFLPFIYKEIRKIIKKLFRSFN